MASRFMADVSSNNGSINIPQYAETGHVAIAIKATEGHDYVNPFHRGWSLQAGAHHLSVWHYHFARPDGPNGPTVEASHFLAATQGLLGPRDYVVLDYERNSPRGVAGDIEWVSEWGHYVHERTRFRPMVYMSESQFNESPRWIPNAPRRAWIAAWGGPTPRVPAGWEMVAHQFTNGVVGPDPHALPGIGRCDVSYLSDSMYRRIAHHR